MDKNKIVEIINDPSIKSNKDLSECLSFLNGEFEKTKETIVTLTKYLDSVEFSYNKINEEISKRIIK